MASLARRFAGELKQRNARGDGPNRRRPAAPNRRGIHNLTAKIDPFGTDFRLLGTGKIGQQAIAQWDL